MQLTAYNTAVDFLSKTQPTLEAQEAANSLMLGVCLQLARQPINEIERPYLVTVEEGPRLVLAAINTLPYNLNLWVGAGEIVQALEMIAADLVARNWKGPGVLGPVAQAEAFAKIYARLSGVHYLERRPQRIFELTAVVPPRWPEGRIRLATGADLGLVADWMARFQEEALPDEPLTNPVQLAQRRIDGQQIYLWEDSKGQPVSMAGKARPTPKGIAVNAVYTPPEFRKRGYASACVARLSQLLLEQGCHFCTLFTDLANLTSNHIYQEIGYRRVLDVTEYAFVYQD